REIRVKHRRRARIVCAARTIARHEEVHDLAIEEISVSEESVGFALEARLRYRIIEHLMAGAWLVGVASRDGNDCREVPSGAITPSGDSIRIHPERRRIRMDVIERRRAIDNRCREAMLGREAIFDVEDETASTEGDAATEGVNDIAATDDETSAVIVDERGKRP